MDWQQVSPGIYTCTLHGYKITKIRGKELPNGLYTTGERVQLYEWTYVAYKEGQQKHLAGTEADIITKVLKSTQQTLFAS